MHHLPELIRDLGLILIIAGITTLLFKYLRQPVVLGYILAGFLVSPSFNWLPTVADVEDIRIWAEIGVIFLLFTLGLEFSFKKLLSTGGSSSITAITEIVFMLFLGYSTGQLLGWNRMDSIFLGGILSVSSTTIIIRAFEELGVKNKKYAKLVFGVLIIEDIVAIILMVMLSTIAVSRQFEGITMLMSILKLAFFLVLWFVAGIFFLPTFFRRVQRYLSDETMLIVSVGLCLLMVILASYAGFSPALGAFIMGSILAETTNAQKIEHIVEPVKNLFAAVFFISVGMLIDPVMLATYALPIFLITVITIFGKLFSTAAGALISGQPLKTALHAGMSMAQIGEFSFIIATLGLSLGVTSEFLYPIAVSVSAVTTFTTPYLIRTAGPLYQWFDRSLPNSWKKALDRYSTGTQNIQNANDWQVAIRAFLAHVILFSIIILGIIALFPYYLKPLIYTYLGNGDYGNIIAATVCLVLISPFLWALVTRKFHTQAFANLWANRRHRAPLIFFRVIRGALAIVYVGILLMSFFSLYIALAGLALLIAVALLFNKAIHSYYIQLENRFFYNYYDRERTEASVGRYELAPWDAHIGQFEVPIGSPVTNMTMEELGLRERLGVNVAMIRRGAYTITVPGRYEKVYPGDILFVIGTDEQLDLFKKYLEPVGDIPVRTEAPAKGGNEIVLKKVRVTADSFMNGKTIRECGVREQTKALVVGIERNGRRILNPESNLILKSGDILWMVGDAILLDKLVRDLRQPRPG